MAKTLFDKVWDEHIVDSIPNGPSILYIDKHLIHEVTSPQAFDGIVSRNINVLRPDRTIATADHNVPTENQHLPIKEVLSRKQVEKLTQNCNRHNIKLYGLGHKYQGIVHVIGPELGLTQPGMTIVCGDSHTSTHGAFGSIAFGIGTSEVEMVLSTQCLLQNKPKTMKIEIDGKLNKGVYSKDIILYIISKISASGGTGYFVEYSGSAIESLSMESRMTICNMSIEMGARGGMIAPDEITFKYIKGKEFAPKGDDLKKKIDYWNSLRSDKDAKYDKIIKFNAEDIEPMITYGTNPGMGIKIDEKIPNSTLNSSQNSFEKSLDYMGINSGEILKNKKIDYVFIGSCTNSRIEDLRAAAKIIQGKNKSSHVNAWVIPGSKSVEKVAVEEGLDKIFTDAGFDFRQPGCSACLAMNEDKIPKDKYCLSTSNRNFEGRQGPGSRTFLASPVTAALSAINGYVSDVRDYI
ncbi:MAG: 3-isopropylmalate dehydratase large subunit [Cytophagales bacterium]